MGAWIAAKWSGQRSTPEAALGEYAVHGVAHTGDWVLAGGLEAPIEPSPSVMVALSEFDSAILAAGSGELGVLVQLFRRGLPAQMSVSMPAEMDPFGEGPSDPTELMEWIRTFAPTDVDETQVRELWMDPGKGSETAWALMHLMGFDPSALEVGSPVHLEGCVQEFLPASDPARIGETEVDWKTVRWAVGQGDGFTGLWDRTQPSGPVATWPDTREGRVAAFGERQKRVYEPILAAFTLDGQRGWLRATPGPSAAYIVHFASDGHMALFNTDTLPRTISISPIGHVTLAGGWLAAVGVKSDGQKTPVEWPLSTWMDCKIAARARLLKGIIGDVVDVPEEVDRSLLGTVEWVRSKVDG
jgi:hypothetical protein